MIVTQFFLVMPFWYLQILVFIVESKILFLYKALASLVSLKLHISLLKAKESGNGNGQPTNTDNIGWSILWDIHS